MLRLLRHVSDSLQISRSRLQEAKEKRADTFVAKKVELRSLKNDGATNANSCPAAAAG